MVALIKPKPETLSDPKKAIEWAIRTHEALDEIQQILGAKSPANVAAKHGAVRVVKIVGATVTDPVTGQTFVADVYVDAVKK